MIVRETMTMQQRWIEILLLLLYRVDMSFQKRMKRLLARNGCTNPQIVIVAICVESFNALSRHHCKWEELFLGAAGLKDVRRSYCILVLETYATGKA